MKYYHRVRPFVLKDSLNKLLDHGALEPKNFQDFWKDVFFFDSGRSALEWILKKIKTKHQHLKVGVQVFTCPVVVNAIYNSNHSPVFIDIDPAFFSTSFDSIQNVECDILILTHLFGQPNPEYLEIAAYCRRRGIFLIEDLALTPDASVNGQSVGSLGDAAIYSFGFDKPLSSYLGGALRINSHEERMRLFSAYSLLTSESIQKGYSDLYKLRLFYELFKPVSVSSRRRFRSYSHFNLHYQLMRNLPKSFVKYFSWFFLSSSFLYRLAPPLPLKQQKMAFNEMTYLSHVISFFNQYRNVWKESYGYAKEFLKNEWPGVIMPEWGESVLAWPHRLPVRVPEYRDEFIKYMNSHGIEAGVFNWSRLVCPDGDEYLYPKAKLLADEIVNLPLWSAEPWKRQ